MAILHGISIEEYHDQIARCSHSRFRDFVNYGPRFYFERFIQKTLAKKTSKALDTGCLFETLFTEGDAALEKLVYIQRGDGRSKEIKPQLEAAKAAGLIPLKSEDYAAMQHWRASALDNADAMALIEPSDQQVTITGEAYGLPFQSRPDYLNLEGTPLTDYEPYTVDLKTCNSLNDVTGSANKLYALGYHTQAAVARALLRVNGHHASRHYLFCVEKTGAFRTKLIRIPDRVLDWADLYFAKYAPALSACLRSNTWPRAEPTEELELPPWAASNHHPTAMPTDEIAEEACP